MLSFIGLIIATIVQLALLMALIISAYALTLYFLAFCIIAARTVFDVLYEKITQSKILLNIKTRLQSAVERRDTKKKEKVVPIGTDHLVTT